MELLQAIKERRSVRSFTDRKIQREKLEKIFDAARWAPSACNKQMWEFVVVESPETRKKIVKEGRAHFFIANAGAVIYVLYPKDVTPEHGANIQSAAAAIQNMILYAHQEGLGTVWAVACGDRKVVREILDIPDKYLIVAAVAIGYAERKPKPPKRRDLRDVVHYEQFGKGRADAKRPIHIEGWNYPVLEQFRSLGIRATAPTLHNFDAFWGDDEIEAEVRWTVALIKKETKILDYLPFAGNHTVQLLQQSPIEKMFVSDVADDILDFIGDRVKKRFGENGKSLELFRGSIKQIPSKDEQYDLVTCYKKLNMIFKPQAALKEIHRILKPNGLLILTIWNKYSLQGIGYSLAQRYRNKPLLVSNEGPFFPISFSHVRKVLNNAGFRIMRQSGLGMLSLQRNKYIFSGIVFPWPLSKLSRTICLVAEKQT